MIRPLIILLNSLVAIGSLLAQRASNVDTIYADAQRIALLDKNTFSWTTYEFDATGKIQRIEELTQQVSPNEYRSQQTNYYEDGRIYQRLNKSTSLDDQSSASLHGQFTEYYEKGNIKKIARYSRDRLHGVLQLYHQIGRLEEIHYYYKGKLCYLEYFGPRGNKLEMEDHGNGSWKIKFWKNGSFCAGPSYKNPKLSVCE